MWGVREAKGGGARAGLVHLAACVSGRGNGGTRTEVAPQSQGQLQMVPPGLAPANFLLLCAYRGPGPRVLEHVAQAGCEERVDCGRGALGKRCEQSRGKGAPVGLVHLAACVSGRKWEGRRGHKD